jgi:hypothetical protein
MRVKVRLQSNAQPIEFNAQTAYQKGNFYCIQVDEIVIKYPISNIFSVSEDYGYHDPKGVV